MRWKRAANLATSLAILRDHPLLDQLIEFRLRHSELVPQDFLGMRAQTRRRPVISDRSPGEPERIDGTPEGRPSLSPLLRDNESSCFDLRIGKHLMQVVDRSGRDA